MARHRDLIQSTDADAPLHVESVIAVRDKFLDASDEEVSDGDGCLSRSMTIKAHNKAVIVETCLITCT